MAKEGLDDPVFWRVKGVHHRVPGWLARRFDMFQQGFDQCGRAGEESRVVCTCVIPGAFLQAIGNRRRNPIGPHVIGSQLLRKRWFRKKLLEKGNDAFPP